MRALKLEPSVPIDVVDIDNDLHALQHALQHAVGGHIEAVKLKDGGAMIVDEEGMLKQYPHNDLASYICGHHIYGTALIVGVNGDKFDDVPEQYFTWLGQ